MLKIDRHETIMQLLNESGSLLVSDACDLLKCSDQTIRRDFQELEEQGKLKRIHGGAFIPTSDDKGVPVKVRARLIVREKLHIAHVAASEFVRSGDIIMLDSSTTCHTLAKHLIQTDSRVTIITNSIGIITEFEESESSSHLFCVGGRYKANLGAFIGTDAVRSITGYVADKAFISCNAIDKKHGILDNYEGQMDIRRAMMAHSRETYLLVDNTKFDDPADFIICDFSGISAVITDREPDASWLEYFRDLGVRVVW